MKLPKYIDQRRNGYFYQRFYPKSVAAFAPAKKFTISLGVKVGASEREIAKAAIVAGEAFDLEVARLSNTSVTAASDAAIDRLAERAMASLKLPDSFVTPAKFPFDIEQMARDQGASPERAREIRDKLMGDMAAMLSGGELATKALDALDEGERALIEAGYTVNEVGDPLEGTDDIRALFDQALPEQTDTDRLVKARVMRRLTTRPSDMPELLSGLWEPYLKYRGVQPDMSNYRFRKKQRDWDNALAAIGDHRINAEAQTAINAGLRARVHDQLARGVKASSAIRSIAMASACFKWASDEWELPWQIRTVRVPKEEQTLRKVATVDQMITMARSAIEWNDFQGAILVLALHGIIPSEIARLEVTRGLASPIPYVLLPPGKTSYRKRLVPIMYAYDLLLDHVDEAIKYCRESKDPSATLNKRLRKMFDEDEQISLYGCRHGIRNCYAIANPAIPIPLIASTLGWSGGEQGMILHYGAEGVDSSEYIEALHDAGKRAHRPIIEALEG